MFLSKGINSIWLWLYIGALDRPMLLEGKNTCVGGLANAGVQVGVRLARNPVRLRVSASRESPSQIGSDEAACAEWRGGGDVTVGFCSVNPKYDREPTAGAGEPVALAREPRGARQTLLHTDVP